MRRFAMLALLVGAGGSLPAQVTLEALNGGTWGSQLNLAQGQAMSFRWKWDGSTSLSAAAWQMSFDAASGSMRNPAIVRSGMVPVPPRQEYGSFQVAGSAVPAGAPSTFYVRMRTAIGFSSWVPVVVSGATSSPLPVANQPIKPPTNVAPTNAGLPDFACTIEGRGPAATGGTVFQNGLQYTVQSQPAAPQFSIVVTVRNAGQKPAILKLQVASWLDGTADIAKVTATPIEPGASQVFTVPSTGAGPWDLDQPNEVRARATLDFERSVTEVDESNNICSTRFILVPRGSRP